MKYFISIVFIYYAGICSCAAQIYASVKRSELVFKLQRAKPDSDKVDILLDLSNAYLKGNMPDSSLFYSAQARELSHTLNRSEDYKQGSFFACKANAIKGDFTAARAVMEQTTGEWKVKMLQELEEQYAFRPGNLPANLDSAWPYVQWFVSYSDTVHTTWAIQNARVVLGKYYFQRGETQKGIDRFYENIKEDQAVGDKVSEAKCWLMLADNLPATFATVPLQLKADSNAIRLYEAAGQHEEAVYALEHIAQDHCQTSLFEAADKEETAAEQALFALGKKMYFHYFVHSMIEIYLGDHARALDYLFRAKKNMDSLKEDFFAGTIDKTFGEVYWAENDIDRSLYWYQLSLRETQGRRDRIIYGTALRITGCLTAQHRLTEARRFLTDFQRDNPAASNRNKEMIAAAWGGLYEAQGLTDEAERAYLEMIRYYRQAIIDQARDIENDYDVATPEANYTMGRFYIRMGQFAKARPFLEQVLQPACVVPVEADIIRDDHLLLYRVDSAAGDLLGAIRQRLLFEKYSDSIFSANKERDLAELQVHYESDKKDQNIALLSKQQQLDRAELSRSTLLRNITVAGLLAALIIIGLLYNQYRAKQKSNNAIELKNEILSGLVREKEWLLKEVHHRVKNNLQTVVSLLDSQSAYLRDDALTAIQDSQNRVFSISLIHQKLYQEENVTRVNIDSYLSELVHHLREAYDIRNQITFQLDLAPITLEVSQAVSIGLILNEAITNTIKHAFPERTKGNIVSITMTIGQNNIVNLIISDNGIGLQGEAIGKHRSLGLKLMKGLTDDLGGSFAISSDQGTTINIRFVANTPFENAVGILSSEKSSKRI
jgi:two-component sensor histidine kinase